MPAAATSPTSQSSHQSVRVSPSFSKTSVFYSNFVSSVATLLLLLLPQVFRKGVKGPVFFVASRGHHADIGGITPGSMPPHSTSLQQEGAVFISFKLVTGGVFQEKGERVQEGGRLTTILQSCLGMVI